MEFEVPCFCVSLVLSYCWSVVWIHQFHAVFVCCIVRICFVVWLYSLSPHVGCDELLSNIYLLTSCSVLLCLCHLKISELFYGGSLS